MKNCLGGVRMKKNKVLSTQFKKFIRKYEIFSRDHNDLCVLLEENMKILLEKESICLEDLDLEKEYIEKFSSNSRNNIYEFEGRHFLSKNAMDLLRKYFEGVVSSVSESVYVEKKKNELFDVESTFFDSIYKVEEEFSYESLIRNWFLHPSIKYEFNTFLRWLSNDDLTENTVKQCKIEINGLSGDMMYPTKFRVVCTHKSKSNDPNKPKRQHTCGRVAEFCELDKFSPIFCTHSISDGKYIEGVSHPLKNLDDVRACEFVKLYSAEANLFTKDGKELYSNAQILSLVPLEDSVCIANVLQTKSKDIDVFFVLSYEKKIVSVDLEEKILVRDEKNFTFLNDIYVSFQRYFKKYHNIEITRQNKYIGELYIFIALSNIFYSQIFRALIIGSSGSGKSWLTNLIFPMLTMKAKTLIGTSVTKNSFMGGRSNVKSVTGNDLFKPGYVATQDVIVLEEATNALTQFSLSMSGSNKFPIDLKDNVFSMIKAANSGKNGMYDVGIQGSKSCKERSSVIVLGNVEQLQSYGEYTRACRRKYKLLSSSSGSDERTLSWFPFLAPLEFYSRELKSTTLMKAMQSVRTKILQEKSVAHYITLLPPAEQSRFHFLVFLEERKPANGVEEVFRQLGEVDNTHKLHRVEMIKELSELFEKNPPKTEELKRLNTEVHEFVYKELFASRNNYISSHFQNTHLKLGVLDISFYYTLMQCRYFSKPLKLDEDCKIALRDFLERNYNTLNAEETCGAKKPRINDIEYIDSYELENEELDTEIKKDKEKEKKEEEDRRALEELSIDFDELEDAI